MQNNVRLNVYPLEAREVPAVVGQFADLMPGIWGSFPRDFVGSGDKVYFVADNGHGEEVYVTDGTAAGTRIPRVVRPGSPSAVPKDLAPAGNGTLYYTADDGTGRALWRTDGTVAGTVKVPGMPDRALTGPDWATAHNSKFYFVVQFTTGTQLWATDGTATTLLATTDGWTSRPGARDGWVYFRSHNDVWRTDGTVAGTSVIAGQPVTGPGGQPGEARPEVEIAPGKWIEYADFGYVDEIRVRDGAGPSQPLKAFDPIPGDQWPHTAVYGVAQSIPGKAVFEHNPASMGGLTNTWWVTDGTAAGTRPVGDLGGAEIGALRDKYDGRLLVATRPTGSPIYTQPTRLALTDTTPAGTTFLNAPDGRTADTYFGLLPPTSAAPKGLLLLATADSKAFVTDGTPGAARWLDITGVPSAALGDLGHYTYQDVLLSDPPPVLNGTVFFAGPRVGDVRPEPWKWDVFAAPTAKPPVVTSVKVNDGATQRSMVTNVTVSFDQAVDLADGAFDLRTQATGIPVGLRVTTQLVGGKTVATVEFTGNRVVGGSLADGVYKFTVNGDRVRAAGTTVAMTDTHTTTVHRLFGDLNGDRTFDRESRWMLYERLGTTRGSARYMAAFDFDSDGDIDKADEWQLLQRYGKSI